MEVASSSVTADILELGYIIGVGGGSEAREDTLAGEEERAGANGEDGSLPGGILLLQLREVIDEAEGFGFLRKDLLGVASKDDEDVKVLKTLMGILEGDLGVNHDALVGEHLGLRTSNGDLKCIRA